MATASVVEMQRSERTDGARLEVVRVIKAKRERVFDAWTRPETIRQWFGSPGKSTRVVKADAHAGGEYAIAMDDGCSVDAASTSASVSGRYVKVEPHHLLQFTWAGDWDPSEESLVTIELKDVDGGTELRLVHEGFVTEMSCSRHGVGWNGALDNMVRLLESNGSTQTNRLEIVRVIKASKQRVFDAWTRPEIVRQWFIVGTVTLAKVSIDLRRDGAWRMESNGRCQPDGTAGEGTNVVTGRYLQVDPYDLLSFTWNNAHFPEEESVVTIRLKEVDGGTEMTLLHDRFLTEASREDHARGWKSVIGNLEKFFAA